LNTETPGPEPIYFRPALPTGCSALLLQHHPALRACDGITGGTPGTCRASPRCWEHLAAALPRRGAAGASARHAASASVAPRWVGGSRAALPAAAGSGQGRRTGPTQPVPVGCCRRWPPRAAPAVLWAGAGGPRRRGPFAIESFLLGTLQGQPS